MWPGQSTQAREGMPDYFFVADDNRVAPIDDSAHRQLWLKWHTHFSNENQIKRGT
jgi:hypothetical protein